MTTLGPRGRAEEIEYIAYLALARANAAGAAAASEQVTFVFRPGGVTSKNVYATWAPLVAAAALVAGPRIVEFDSRFAPCVIPAGVWNFGPVDNVTFKGADLASATVAIADGATLVGFAGCYDLSIDYFGTTVPCITAPRLSFYNIEFGSSLRALGGQPFIRAVAGVGAFTAIVLSNSSATNNFGGGGTIFDSGPGGFLQLLIEDDSAIQANTVGNGGGVGSTFVNSASPSATISLTQAGMGGGLLVPGVTFFAGSRPIETMVIDPTVVNPVGNVFNTFEQAVGYAANFRGLKVFEFRGVAPVIAVGVYNLGVDPIRFQGDGTFLANLTIANGATFPSPPSITFADMSITWLGATPLIDVSVGSRRYIFDNVSLSNVGAGATAPFIRSSGTGIAEIDLLRASQVFPQAGGGPQFTSVTLGSFTVFNAYDASVVGQNSLGISPGGFVGGNQVDTANVNLPQVGFNLAIGSTLILNGTTDRMFGPNGGSPAIQAGSGKIDGVSGKSLHIPAFITATSSIQAFLADDLGGAATTRYGASLGDRVIGPPPLGGFKVMALAGAALNVADGSTFDWQVTN